MKSLLTILFIACLTTLAVSQPFGNAVFLDGVSSTLEIPNHDSLHSATNLTLEAWIKPCNITGTNVIFSKVWCSGQQNSYFFSVQDGKLKWVWYSANCGVSSGTNRYKSIAAIIQANVWQHVAVVHSPTGVKLFLNGVEVAATLEVGSYGNLRPSTDPIRVGAYKTYSGNLSLFFSGQMDELRVWNQSIADSLILARYNGQLVGNEPSLMGYYDMNNTTVGPNKVVPNMALSIGSAGNGVTKGSSSYITPFYLDTNTSYILGPDTQICNPFNFNLNALIPSGTYLWQNGSMGSSFTVNNVGQFSVNVSNSCVNTYDSITVSTPSSIVVNLGNDTIICNVNNFLLDAGNSGANFVWSDGSNGQTLSVSQPGIYSVTVFDTCQSIVDSIVVSESIPLTTISALSCGPYTSPSGNHVWNNTGIYQDSLVTILGCDSVIEVNLTITPIPITNLSASNCYSYTAPSGNHTWYSTGVYHDTLSSSTGCDSILSISLTILPYELINLNDSACVSYTSPSGNNTWSTSGTYIDLVSHVNDCDTLYNITLTINQNSNATISVSSCDSYTSPSGNYIWSTSGVFADTIPNYMGCDSIMTINLTIHNSQSINQIATSCDSYTWSSNGVTYWSSGVYGDTTTNIFGCDSINILDLTINSGDTINFTQISCDSYSWNVTGATYTQSGIYSSTFTNQYGCDSIVSLDLTINTSSFSTSNIIACDTYTSPSGNYIWSTSGVFMDTISNSAGCDSIMTIHLTIHNSQSNNQIVTSCGSYTWISNGVTYWSSGVYSDTLTNTLGCDSINTLSLTINSGDTNSFTQTSCDSYLWNVTGVTYTQSGIYSSSFTNQNGCDSIFNLDLTINSSSSSALNITTCNTYTSPSGNYTWTASGVYLDTIPNSMGCDSLITINLIINQPTYGNLATSSCNSYTSPSGNFVWVSSGTYQDTINNSNGCDSILTIQLTIHSTSFNTQNVVACDSYTWGVNGANYVNSGVYLDTLTNTVGCDSIVSLTLTINQSTIGSETVNACNSYTWAANGLTYTNTGVYSTTILNAVGCDSIVTLNLTVGNTVYTNQTITACDSLVSPSGGSVYYSSGTYMDTMNTSLGCDSIITTIVTVNYASSSSLTASACNSYYWGLNNTNYNTSGTYTIMVNSSTGCDSVVTLFLTINTNDTVTQVFSTCSDYTWPVNNMNYTTSGIYSELFINSNGCDSLMILDLNILPNSTGSETITACDSFLWSTNNATYLISGVYTALIQNSMGCDSLVTLNLTINNSQHTNLVENECDRFIAPDGSVFTQSGIYEVIIPSSLGCDSIITISLTIDSIDLNVSQSSNVLTAVSNSNYTYQWIDCDKANQPINGAQSNVYTPTSNGMYAVVINNVACQDTSACIPVVNLSVENIEFTSVRIFPNPVSDVVNIRITDNKGVKVIIVDLTSKTIYDIDSNEETIQIDCSNFPSGMYMVKVNLGSVSITEKIIVR